MTISSSTSIASFEGNGIAVNFPFTFKVWEVSQLKVIVIDKAGLSSAPHFTATLTETGGTVTFLQDGAPLPTGWKLSVMRDMPFEQDVDLVSGTRFDPQVIEDQMDKATAERQQLREAVGRAIAMPAGYTETPQELLNRIFEARETAVTSAGSAVISAAEAAHTVEEGSLRINAEADAQVCRIVDNGNTQVALAAEQATMAAQSAANALGSEGSSAQSAVESAEYARIAQEALEQGAPNATDIVKGVSYLSDAMDSASGVAGSTAATPLAVRKVRDFSLDMAWSSAVNYPTPCIRVGSNGKLYLWRAPSGPAVSKVGAKDPTMAANAAYWLDYTASISHSTTPYFDPATGIFNFPGYAGQFESFQLPTPPENWRVCTGGWLENADTGYPELWRNLQHPAFAILVVTDAVWTQRSTAAGGVGGVPLFVVDVAAKRIRLPDTRGDYTRAAGSSYLQTVGGWHDSEFKSHVHEHEASYSATGTGVTTSVLTGGHSQHKRQTTATGGSETHTRAYAMLGCVCVGPTQTQPSLA